MKMWCILFIIYQVSLQAKPAPSCFTSLCSSSTSGPAVVMRGQKDRQPGFTHGAGGRGQAGKAKGYAGLRCILKWHQLQIPLAEFCVRPITAHKIALWSKKPCWAQTIKRSRSAYLKASVKSAHLSIKCSCHLYWGKVDRRRGFFSLWTGGKKRAEQKHIPQFRLG